MEQYTTGYSPNASLAMIAEWTKRKGIWEKLEAGVHIQQKIVIHTPHEKLKDLMINMWAGGEGVADVNYRVRTDTVLQKLLGEKFALNNQRSVRQ